MVKDGKSNGDKLLFGRCCKAVEVWDKRERRKDVRFPICLSVVYEKNKKQDVSEFILNISKGGLFIKTESPAPLGSSIKIVLYIPPDGKKIGRFNGRVVEVSNGCLDYCQRKLPKGMHIIFTDCTPEDRAELLDFIEENQHLLDEDI